MTVSLAEAKAHLNVVSGDDDDLISGKIEAAEAWVAAYVGSIITPMPATVREAVLQLTAHWYENREATLIGISADELPFGVYDLLAPHREYHF